MNQSEIDTRFSYHAPKADQPAKYQRIRDEGKALAMTLVELCPDCRELATALTKLDEMVMHANAAIARRS